MNEILLKTLMLSAGAASKVDEIHIQLSVLQRQCNYRDRPLCDTLKVKSFEEMGFMDRLKIVRIFVWGEFVSYVTLMFQTKLS
jgi:hypothetical protein